MGECEPGPRERAYLADYAERAGGGIDGQRAAANLAVSPTFGLQCAIVADMCDPLRGRLRRLVDWLARRLAPNA
jgi:hypothetical protein